MIKFDFISATLDCPAGKVINFLTDQIDLTSSQRCKPRYGYEQGALISRGSQKIASVYWGGPNGNAGTHVTTSGSQSSDVRSALRQLARQLNAELIVTRMDACKDIVQAGFFDRVAALCTEVAQRKGLKISQLGDWVRSEGRTLYIGSRQSETMIRIYEKGFRDGGDVDWVRLELEFKPRTRRRRIAAGSFKAEEVFSMGIGSHIFPALGLDTAAVPDLPSAHRPADTNRSRHFLIRQYGPTMAQWADEVGSYQAFARVLESEIRERMKLPPKG